MALAAMSDEVGEVVAAVPRRILAGDRLQRPRGEEQRAPAELQEAPRERRRDLMPLVALRDRLLDLEIGPEIGDVLVVHPGEGGIGKDGKIMRAVLGNALAQGAVEIREAPGAEPGLLVRRDVGRIERAERRRQGAAAGEALAIVLGIGVAAEAIRRVEDIGAALDSRLVGAARSEQRSS